MNRIAVLDSEGSVFCFISPGAAQRALNRREVILTDDPRILSLAPDLDKRQAGRGLSPEQKRRRYLRAA